MPGRVAEAGGAEDVAEMGKAIRVHQCAVQKEKVRALWGELRTLSAGQGSLARFPASRGKARRELSMLSLCLLPRQLHGGCRMPDLNGCRTI